MKIIIDMEKHI